MRKNQGKGEEVEDDAEKNRGGFGLTVDQTANSIIAFSFQKTSQALHQQKSLSSETFHQISNVD